MQQVVFYIFAALAVGGGLGVVLSQNVVRAALSLILTLGAVAGLFILLAAEFLALVQLLVYGGAVAILMLFALMLTRARELPRVGFGAQWPFAVIGAGGFLAAIVTMVAKTEWRAPDEPADHLRRMLQVGVHHADPGRFGHAHARDDRAREPPTPVPRRAVDHADVE